MLATHQVVKSEDQILAFAEMNRTVCCGSSNTSDDAASECSTAFDIQGTVARADDDILSDCHSDILPEADALLIFDWDDTLFPTSWIQEQGLLKDGATITIEQRAELDKVSEHVRSTLQMASTLGKIVIVTNAEQGWIEASCTRFTPSLISLLKTVDMVSARTSFEHCSCAPSEWKRMAFSHEVDLFYGPARPGQRQNVLSVGDSLHELNALVSVTRCTPQCTGKSIKLLDVPNIDQLIEQHEVLVVSLRDVIEHDGNMDIEIGAESSE